VYLAFPEVGGEYVPETLGAEAPHQLAALELAMHAIGRKAIDFARTSGCLCRSRW
jgi:hypothetical protein